MLIRLFFNFTYSVKCFSVPNKISSRTPWWYAQPSLKTTALRTQQSRYLPSMTWRRNQIQFHKVFSIYLEFQIMLKSQKPSDPELCTIVRSLQILHFFQSRRRAWCLFSQEHIRGSRVHWSWVLWVVAINLGEIMTKLKIYFYPCIDR
jgi:hypothetical protein